MTIKKPTMKDVAQLAGVTQPTVSYVINGTAPISEEVKEKVFKAIEELHYKPNYNAVALKTQRTGVIGIVIADITNMYYSYMSSMLEKELTRRGYLALIGSTGYKEKVEIGMLNRFLDHNVEALIIAYELGNPECWKLLTESGKKVITIEGGSVSREFPGIEIDHYFGAYTAARHLLEEGRRHIAYIGQESGIEALQIRERGYLGALRESGRQPLILRVGPQEDKWEEGLKIGETLAKKRLADGIVVSSDEIALGVIKALSTTDIRIPEDISVIGYDDIPLAGHYIPELTTVAQPLQETCRHTVDMLMEYLGGSRPGSKMLKPELILRDTTRPLMHVIP